MLKNLGLSNIEKISSNRQSNSSTLILIWLMIGLAFIFAYGYCLGSIIMSLLEVGINKSAD